MHDHNLTTGTLLGSETGISNPTPRPTALSFHPTPSLTDSAQKTTSKGLLRRLEGACTYSSHQAALRRLRLGFGCALLLCLPTRQCRVRHWIVWQRLKQTVQIWCHCWWACGCVCVVFAKQWRPRRPQHRCCCQATRQCVMQMSLTTAQQKLPPPRPRVRGEQLKRQRCLASAAFQMTSLRSRQTASFSSFQTPGVVVLPTPNHLRSACSTEPTDRPSGCCASNCCHCYHCRHCHHSPHHHQRRRRPHKYHHHYHHQDDHDNDHRHHQHLHHCCHFTTAAANTRTATTTTHTVDITHRCTFAAVIAITIMTCTLYIGI